MRARLKVLRAERQVWTSDAYSDGRDLSRMIAMNVSDIFNSSLLAVFPSKFLCNDWNWAT